MPEKETRSIAAVISVMKKSSETLDAPREEEWDIAQKRRDTQWRRRRGDHLGVDLDDVAVAQDREHAAVGRLGRHVAHHDAVRSAREAPVGDQRHVLAEALATRRAAAVGVPRQRGGWAARVESRRRRVQASELRRNC